MLVIENDEHTMFHLQKRYIAHIHVSIELYL